MRNSRLWSARFRVLLLADPRSRLWIGATTAPKCLFRVRNPGRRGLTCNGESVLLPACHRDTLTVAMEPTGTYGNVLGQALFDAGIRAERVSHKVAHDYAEVFDGVPLQFDGKDAAVVADLAALGNRRSGSMRRPAQPTRRWRTGWIGWMHSNPPLLTSLS